MGVLRTSSGAVKSSCQAPTISFATESNSAAPADDTSDLAASAGDASESVASAAASAGEASLAAASSVSEASEAAGSAVEASEVASRGASSGSSGSSSESSSSESSETSVSSRPKGTQVAAQTFQVEFPGLEVHVKAHSFPAQVGTCGLPVLEKQVLLVGESFLL